MKKSLLMIAAMAATVAANAVTGTDVSKRPTYVNNLLTNGDFEDKNYVQTHPDGYSWSDVADLINLDELPGWTLNTAGIWNGICWIEEQEVDDEYVLEGNEQMLHIRHYHENGWTSMKWWQIVTGLDTTKEYTVDFIIAKDYESADWVTRTRGVTIKEGDSDGFLIGTITDEDDDVLNEWSYIRGTFVPSTPTIYFEFYASSPCYEGNWQGECWVDVDEIRLYDADEEVEVPGDDNALSTISVDNTEAAVYYNLQGVRLSQPEGICIMKTGNKTVKVIK